MFVVTLKNPNKVIHVGKDSEEEVRAELKHMEDMLGFTSETEIVSIEKLGT